MTRTSEQLQPSRPEEGRCLACGEPLAGEEPRCGFCGVALRAGRYRVERVLSQGPHGRVYRARDGQGPPVALKELLFASVPEARQVDAFEREAATLKALAHPAIPRYVDSFAEGSGVHLRLYLVSELVEGEPLSARIGREPLSEPELRRLAGQVLDVLRYLHGRPQPVLHRDLKPDNLILRPDGAVALVDFGSARWLGGPRTHGSTLVGTFGYMPPEQLGGTVDVTSDLYALGATLLHAATGQPPSELLRDGLALKVPERVPAGLRPLLERLVHPNPERRFPDAEAVLRALQGQSPAPATRWRRVLAVALLVAGVVAPALALRPLLGESGAGGGEAGTKRALASLRYGGDAAKRWFLRARTSCNALEASQYLARNPVPSGWDGAGYGAACFALAGRVGEARALLERVEPGRRPWAAAIVFELGHAVADSGDDISAGPLMRLVLESWPDNYQALYHAGMSDYALGHTAEARQALERFLSLYPTEDGFRRNAQDALARIARGLPPATAHPGAH